MCSSTPGRASSTGKAASSPRRRVSTVSAARMCSQIHSGIWYICSISSLYNCIPFSGHSSWSGTARCPMASAPWTPTAMPGTRARTRSSAMPATCWETSCSIKSASPATASWLCSAWRRCHRIDGKSVMSAGEQERERDEGEGWHGAEVLTAYTCCIDLALTFYGACHTRTTCELCSLQS